MDEETQKLIQQQMEQLIIDLNRALNNAIIAFRREKDRQFGQPGTKIYKPDNIGIGIVPCQMRIRAWQQHRG